MIIGVKVYPDSVLNLKFAIKEEDPSPQEKTMAEWLTLLSLARFKN